jgi:hypothetical protein
VLGPHWNRYLFFIWICLPCTECFCHGLTDYLIHCNSTPHSMAFGQGTLWMVKEWAMGSDSQTTCFPPSWAAGLTGSSYRASWVAVPCRAGQGSSED